MGQNVIIRFWWESGSGVARVWASRGGPWVWRTRSPEKYILHSDWLL